MFILELYQAWLSNRPTTSKPEHTTGRKERVYQDDIQSNKGNIMTTEQIIELLESIDQNINYGNLDEAQVDIAINLRTLYKQLVKK